MSMQCLATTWNFAFCNSLKANYMVVKRLKMISGWLATIWNITFSTSHKQHFGMVKRPKMSSKWHAIPWINAFSTLPKSHFGLVKRKQMCSQCLATTWNVAFLTSPKSNFGLVKRQKMTFNPGELARAYFDPRRIYFSAVCIFLVIINWQFTYLSLHSSSYLTCHWHFLRTAGFRGNGKNVWLYSFGVIFSPAPSLWMELWMGM